MRFNPLLARATRLVNSVIGMIGSAARRSLHTKSTVSTTMAPARVSISGDVQPTVRPPTLAPSTMHTSSAVRSADPA